MGDDDWLRGGLDRGQTRYSRALASFSHALTPAISAASPRPPSSLPPSFRRQHARRKSVAGLRRAKEHLEKGATLSRRRPPLAGHTPRLSSSDVTAPAPPASVERAATQAMAARLQRASALPTTNVEVAVAQAALQAGSMAFGAFVEATRQQGQPQLTAELAQRIDELRGDANERYEFMQQAERSETARRAEQRAQRQAQRRKPPSPRDVHGPATTAELLGTVHARRLPSRRHHWLVLMQVACAGQCLRDCLTESRQARLDAVREQRLRAEENEALVEQLVRKRRRRRAEMIASGEHQLQLEAQAFKMIAQWRQRFKAKQVRHEAVDTLKWFARHARVRRAIKGATRTYKVKCLQAFWRSFAACSHARLEALCLVWEYEERAALAEREAKLVERAKEHYRPLIESVPVSTLELGDLNEFFESAMSVVKQPRHCGPQPPPKHRAFGGSPLRELVAETKSQKVLTETEQLRALLDADAELQTQLSRVRALQSTRPERWAILYKLLWQARREYKSRQPDKPAVHEAPNSRQLQALITVGVQDALALLEHGVSVPPQVETAMLHAKGLIQRRAAPPHKVRFKCFTEDAPRSRVRDVVLGWLRVREAEHAQQRQERQLRRHAPELNETVRGAVRQRTSVPRNAGQRQAKNYA